MLHEVRDGLSRAQKEIPPKYFYDTRGSLLFEEITRLPEYYLTRAERSILEEWMPPLMRHLRAASFAELGAGNGEKGRVILDAMEEAGSAQAYLPIDVSVDFLGAMSDDLRAEYPSLEIRPIAADMTAAIPIPADVERPLLVALLGSTIGNFDEASSVRLLRRVRRAMRSADRFLLGADLRKDPKRLAAAYNDSRGVTAEFNRNVLHVLNRELGADFEAVAFEHRAVYDETLHRIEMHLVAGTHQVVTIPGAGVFDIAAGEHILTEISVKYDRRVIDELCAASGLEIEAWRTDADELFALALLAPVP
jgi:L-histidine N-alpha-methyltransferase